MLRHTQYYRTLLVSSLSPEICLSTESRRKFLFDYLDTEGAKYSNIIEHEVRSLLNIEIPSFYHVISKKDLFVGDHLIEGFIRDTGISLVRRDIF